MISCLGGIALIVGLFSDGLLRKGERAMVRLLKSGFEPSRMVSTTEQLHVLPNVSDTGH